MIVEFHNKYNVLILQLLVRFILIISFCKWNKMYICLRASTLKFTFSQKYVFGCYNSSVVLLCFHCDTSRLVVSVDVVISLKLLWNSAS